MASSAFASRSSLYSQGILTKAIVSRVRYLDCAEPGSISGKPEIKILESYDEPVIIEGKEYASKAFTIEVKGDVGLFGLPSTLTRTIHSILVDGSWAWVLRKADIDAYRDGRCP